MCVEHAVGHCVQGASFFLIILPALKYFTKKFQFKLSYFLRDCLGLIIFFLSVGAESRLAVGKERFSFFFQVDC